jgi:hypothetical protein
MLSSNVMRNVKHKIYSPGSSSMYGMFFEVYMSIQRIFLALTHVHNRTDQFNSKAITPQNLIHIVGIIWRITFGLINQCMYGSDSLNCAPHLLHLKRRWLLDIRRDWLWYTKSCKMPDADANPSISS